MSRPSRASLAAGLAVGLTLLAVGLGRPGPARAAVVARAPQTLAGGFSAASLGGLAVGRDGGGALAFRASAGGVTQIDLARLSGGTFSSPQALDSGSAANLSTPVVASGNGGALVVAWVDGQNLYAVTATPGGAPGSPQLLASGAADPAVGMNTDGDAYIAYTVPAGAGDDVEVQYWDTSRWTPAGPAVMNASPGDTAGAPSVWAATDGVGIVTWAEAGHIFARRIWGTSTSSEVQQLDPAGLDGAAETTSAAPQIAAGGDSTYPDIVFSETFATASGNQTRTMLTRLVAEDSQPAVPVDGLAAGDGLQASRPAVAMGEIGRGLISTDTGPVAGSGSGTTTGAGVTTTPAPAAYPADGAAATVLTQNGARGATTTVPSQPSAQPLDAVPATFGSITSAVAWVQTDANATSVQLRYAADGITLATPLTLSDPAAGSVQAADGLGLAGDGRGDGAAAWVQDSGGRFAVETAQLYTPPSSPALNPATVVTHTSQPTLSWNASAEDWGAPAYGLLLNGNAVASTTATSLTVPAALPDGSYSWQVQATNSAGQSATSGSGRLIIDTVAPQLALRLSGAPRVGAVQRLDVIALDAPNPAEPSAVASGIAAETVDWGDGTTPGTGTRLTALTHRYLSAGLFRIRVQIADRAQNTTTLTQLVRVLG